jgi:uncharacterized protein
MARLAFGLSAVVLAAALIAPRLALADNEPTKPNPKLPTETVTITGQDGKPHVFTIEVASTPSEQTTGLMFRTSVPANSGMIFPWDPPIVSQMWMENTLVPLDMVFIGADGTIKAIAENTVPESLRVISSGVPVAATLELQGGITAKLDIDVGDKVVIGK